MSLHRLLPEPGATTVEEQLESVGFAELAGQERPYVYTNFVLTLEGRATLEGRSGPIGSAIDTAMLMGLRAQAEAVLIGAGTMRTERYGRLIPDAEARARREGRGLPPDPLAVIVSGRLDLPWDAPMFTCGEGRVVVWTASDGEPPDTATPLHIERHEGMVDLGRALSTLRREHGIRALLCEGGPHLHAELIEAELVDELFITHAPKLAGGEGPHLVAGLPERERPLELAWLLHEEATGELFGRYLVKR